MFRKVIGWSLVALLVLFIAQNLDMTPVHLGFVSLVMPRAFVIFFSAALGAGAVYALKYFRPNKRE